MVNLRPGSQPDENDEPIPPFTITKNSKIYRNTNHQKVRTDISALKKGHYAEIIWRFAAKEHLVEAVEISLK
ncbi:hypothetical protein [Paenibacillus humicola]|uniref:hypothetical protein n=1 Tax=Paenibacillus humicola TaxID=3110540 RepID=UPI00237A3F10|nr:hypothetical protein [Paenibacillus humicola]